MQRLERSHVFVARDGLILALRQASGLGWWELPGGQMERGEDPLAAAVRETQEETGLRIAAPDLLRTWSHRNGRGVEVLGHAYAAHAPPGEVTLSHEHVEYAWMSVEEYEDRYCGEAIDVAAPRYAEFLAGMRENCRLFSAWLKARSAPRSSSAISTPTA